MTANTTQVPTSQLADDAAPLDVLLVEALPSPVRRFLPDMSTARWAVSLARRPRTTARRLGALGAEAGRIVTGTSTVSPRRGDRRFTDEGWADNPLLKRLLQLYLASGQSLEQLVADADLDPRDRKRVGFLLENLVEALAPSNVPLVNPASAKAAIDTAGLSLVRGGRQLVKDLAAAPRIPEMVDTTGFELGENIAATPGAVVFRSEVLELIQYQPQTDEVHEVPILMVPPTINKYYAIDLAPGRSLVEYGVGQGRQVFVISWRNPDARHSEWGFDTYVGAVLDTLDAVQRIAGADRAALEPSIKALGLSAWAVATAPAVATHDLDVPRIGYVHSWTRTQDEGWWRVAFDRFEVPFELIYKDQAKQGNLRAKYDVIVLPKMRMREIVEGRAKETAPAEFTGGIGEGGVANLRRFVEEGGTLVCWDDSTELPLKHFNLPVRNVLEGLRPADFYCPGSVLRVEVETSHPLARGYRPEADAYFVNSAAFEVTDTRTGKNIGIFYFDGYARSGKRSGAWATRYRGQQKFEATLGKGRVILFGFRPQHRGQTFATFPFIFNAIQLNDER